MRKRNYSVQKKSVPITNHSSNFNFPLTESNNPFSGLTGAALDAELSAQD